MDLFKYQIELDKISKDVTSKYLKNNNSNYKKAKSWLIKSFKMDRYKDISDSVPFFSLYFRKNFIFFCRQAPNFVGSVLHSYIYLTSSDIKIFLETLGKRHLNMINEEYYTAAENSYKDTRKLLFKIQRSPKILKTDVNRILSLFELLSKEFYYEKAQYLYIRLFQEIIFSLQLLNNIEDLNKLVYPHHGFMGNGPKLLARFDKLKKKKPHKYTFISLLFEDLTLIYKKIDKLILSLNYPKQDLTVENIEKLNPLSDVRIKMIPRLGNVDNEIIINDKIVLTQPNSAFDFLYMFLFMRKNNKDGISEIYSYDKISEEIRTDILKHDNTLKRFNRRWAQGPGRDGRINDKSQKTNIYNDYFKELLKTKHHIIINSDSVYELSKDIKPKNIELVDY